MKNELTKAHLALVKELLWDKSGVWLSDDTLREIHAAFAVAQIGASTHPSEQGRDWDLLEATQESLREHMAEIQRLRAFILEQSAQQPLSINGLTKAETDATASVMGIVGKAQQQEPVWEMFAAYLLDKCEGEKITEEFLQRALADMLDDPKYHAPQPAQQQEPVALVDGAGKQLTLMQALDHAIKATEKTGSGRLNKVLVAAKQALAEQPAQQRENVSADAYDHACDEMERWQRQRRKAGKEVGTTGSLCDGIAWLYGYIDELEKKIAQQEPVAIVEAVVPHLESIVVKHILDAPFPKVGDFLYTSPPASKPWVSLTPEEANEIYHKAASLDEAMDATETKLREKNA